MGFSEGTPHRVGEFDFHDLRLKSGCPYSTPFSTVIIFTIEGGHPFAHKQLAALQATTLLALVLVLVLVFRLRLQFAMAWY